MQSDNYWLNARTPCVTYGLRGVVTFQMTVCGPKEDLHSGMFGRMVHEPMTDLAILMSKLVAPCGKILIDEVEDMVPAPTDKERYVHLCPPDRTTADGLCCAGRSTRIWTIPSRT